MKSKISYIIGSLFVGYIIFVVIVVFVYETRPEDRSWQERQEFNHKMLSEITIGQTIESIRQVMGRADFSEAKASTEGSFQIMFYRTHHVASDGKTTKDECTPLLFKDGQLIAWGQETYDQFLQIPILAIIGQSQPITVSEPNNTLPSELNLDDNSSTSQ
ncbi:DUF3192 domain-containing protein [Shewanella donghaensis]|uniref:DUF3192 domain-containing protein n=1 Tax=Shewanella donghaensis TaxID=238836 RepID=UPI0011845477|nr:DUF3192 domain-containing protein [Shewanella donghaensis]